MHSDRTHDRHRWFVFAVFASIYFFVYFHRVSTSVIAPDLLAAFQINATALGFMSSMYFYLYSIEQPLVGYLSDFLGSRRVIGFWSLIAASGCMLFGLAPTITWATVGRGLIGFGVGGVYVPAMKAISQWFPKKNLGTMTGCLIAVGNVGAIFATSPLAWVSRGWGWRSAFFAIGVMTLCLSLVALLMVRDPGKAHEGEPAPAKSGAPSGSAFQVLASPRFWVLAFLFFGVFGGTVALQGLWATPFVMSSLGLGQYHASLVNLLIPIGYIVGALFFGWLGDRFFLHRVDLIMTLLMTLTGTWIAIAFAGGSLGLGGMIAAYAVLGAMSGGLATSLWATVLQTTPQLMTGLTTGLLNPFPLLGMGVMQALTGAVLDRTGKIGEMYPPEAYRNAFTFCLLASALCLLVCLASRKRLIGLKRQ